MIVMIKLPDCVEDIWLLKNGFNIYFGYFKVKEMDVFMFTIIETHKMQEVALLWVVLWYWAIMLLYSCYTSKELWTMSFYDCHLFLESQIILYDLTGWISMSAYCVTVIIWNHINFISCRSPWKKCWHHITCWKGHSATSRCPWLTQPHPAPSPNLWSRFASLTELCLSQHFTWSTRCVCWLVFT